MIVKQKVCCRGRLSLVTLVCLARTEAATAEYTNVHFGAGKPLDGPFIVALKCVQTLLKRYVSVRACTMPVFTTVSIATNACLFVLCLLAPRCHNFCHIHP